MPDHTMCRSLLSVIMKEVYAKVPYELVMEAWAYNYNDGHCEFQIPSENLYWYGSACCAWIAKYHGWTEYLNRDPERAKAYYELKSTRGY